MNDWEIKSMKKDSQSITADWQLANQKLIDGVHIKEISNVPTNKGYLTEIYRTDWKLDKHRIQQIFQVNLNPGAISAWHAHSITTDRLFVNKGTIRIVLYDSRKSSSTYKLINEFCFGAIRPALVVVPPMIWHGIENISNEVSSLINIVDKAYDYVDPDHYRLPPNTKKIPYSFGNAVQKDAIK
jgi:dTDP-4-dehydrorhamnose 3,5-epimerase